MTTTAVKSGGWTVFSDGVITFTESGVQLWTDNVERLIKSESAARRPEPTKKKSHPRIWNGCTVNENKGLDGSIIRTIHIRPRGLSFSETAMPVKVRCVSYRGETWYEIQESE